MNTLFTRTTLAASLALTLALTATPPARASGPTGFDPLVLRMFGLTADQRLIRFIDRLPKFATSVGYVQGLSGDNALVGIDFRVQDGKLYGVGNAGGVYTINTGSAVATKVSQLTIALSGNRFGVDFNPAADRLRVVSDTAQNLRHNVNPGGITLMDTALSYSAGTTATGIAAAAYTNNDLAASTATTLFDLDTALDQIALQSPANAGTLAATGQLGVDASAIAGLDIYSTLRNGVTVDVEAFATLKSSADGGTRLYEVNLYTGKAYLRGSFASHNAPVDIAIPLQQR